jgi:hypothetical protein
LYHFGISKIVLTYSGQLFGLFSFASFSFGTFGSFFGLFLGFGGRLGGSLFLVFIVCLLVGGLLGLDVLRGWSKILTSDFLKLDLTSK